MGVAREVIRAPSRRVVRSPVHPCPEVYYSCARCNSDLSSHIDIRGYHNQLKVLLWPGDTGGCAFHRMRLPGGIAKANGVDVEVLDKVPARVQADGSYRVVTQGFEADLIVIQRPLYRHIAEAIPLFQEEGIAVAVEIDDDLSALPKNHLAYKRIHPDQSPDLNWNWFDIAIQSCDYLICSTVALARKYGDPDTTSIIRNYIPKEITEIEKKKPLHSVGWTSSVETHPNDLQVTRGGVSAAIQESGASLYVIGDTTNVAKNLGCAKDVKVHTPGWVDIEEYYHYLRAIEVGIVPLELTQFNQAKSNLKGLEFAALGIPFVASETEEYIALANQGAGSLASSSSQWYDSTLAYLTDEFYRNDMGEQARETVKRYYLLEDNWHHYPEAWESAIMSYKGHRGGR